MHGANLADEMDDTSPRPLFFSQLLAVFVCPRWIEGTMRYEVGPKFAVRPNDGPAVLFLDESRSPSDNWATDVRVLPSYGGNVYLIIYIGSQRATWKYQVEAARSVSQTRLLEKAFQQ